MVSETAADTALATEAALTAAGAPRLVRPTTVVRVGAGGTSSVLDVEACVLVILGGVIGSKRNAYTIKYGETAGNKNECH